jgi:hypothetical protein
VIDRDGVALEGLYAVGNDAASVMGGTYPDARYHHRCSDDVWLCRRRASGGQPK